jgi:hypothetical protein
MEGIPGHSKVSSTVHFRCLQKSAFHKVLLAGKTHPPGRAGRSSRNKYVPVIVLGCLTGSSCGCLAGWL